MTDCTHISMCSFFTVYGAREGSKTAVAGFVRLYCKGDRQDQCVRKAVSKAIGGPHNIPANMLPNGLPISGTDDQSWSDGVKKAANRK